MNDNSIKINDSILNMEKWIERGTLGNGENSDENDKKSTCSRKKEIKHKDSENKLHHQIHKSKEYLKRQDENDNEMAIKKEINKINECANCTNSDETKDYTIIVPPRKKIKNMKNEEEEEEEEENENNRRVNGEDNFIHSTKNYSSEEENSTELMQSSVFDLKSKNKKLRKKSICDRSEEKLDAKEKKEASINRDGQGKKWKKDKKGKRCDKIDIKKNNKMVDQSSDEKSGEHSCEESDHGSNDDISNPRVKRKSKKMDKQKKRKILSEKLNKTKKTHFKKEKNGTKNDKQKYAKYKRIKENIKMTFDVTSRFTVLGCDWDNICSADIFYLFESYYNFEKRKKKNIDYNRSRAVKKVTIYTSKYGEKKLKQEKKYGPKINLDILKLRRKNEDAVYRRNNCLDYLHNEDIDEGSHSSCDEGGHGSSSDDNESEHDIQNTDDDSNVEGDSNTESNSNAEDGSNGEDDSNTEGNNYAKGGSNGEDDESADNVYSTDNSNPDDDSNLDDEESANNDSCTDDDINIKDDEHPKKKKEKVKKSSKDKIKKNKNNRGLLHTSNTDDEEEENEKIRLYQIQRSRYYFAVVECYNKEIVEFLYEELNDMDADFCINYLDLRIINDNCSLDEYKIKEFCDKIPENYQFHYTVSTALKHTHVKPTWDENPKRKKLLSTRFSEEKLRELDLKEYLANSSSSSDEEEKEDDDNKNGVSFKKKEKYNRENIRKLLLGDLLSEDDTEDVHKVENNIELLNSSSKNTYEDDDKINFSIYFNEIEEDFANKDKIINLLKEEKYSSNINEDEGNSNELAMSLCKKTKEKKKQKKKGRIPESEEDSDKDNEVVQVFKNMLKNNDQKEEKKNPWDKYLDRVRQKKKLKKKAYLESLKKKDEEIKKIITKKTNKRKKDVMLKNNGENFSEKVNDSHQIDRRFADIYKNKDFNLDITNPNFKKTKFNEDILQKKL
ncbi:small subunit rRNA processing factor [Plasmodium gonderi]|uniref:Small subunit rRNA processing factor n=1 Tax=Plasmodium gonderi TaxID=77519 RepID=A0A1Y1JS35_PLAGO|nr:small subunit rRNA processing factor [Plasmodium gonderi]GAW82804.1 small subunit rRNA processing factor [Plasmodium gonderi]